MFKMLLLIADMTIAAERGEEKWTVEFQGQNKYHKVLVTDEQFAAIMAMTIAAEQDIDWVEKLRPICEVVLEKCPNDCKPIP